MWTTTDAQLFLLLTPYCISFSCNCAWKMHFTQLQTDTDKTALSFLPKFRHSEESCIHYRGRNDPVCETVSILVLFAACFQF